MTTLQTGIMISVIAVSTFATRAIAFLLFPANKPTPRFVVYLGRVLPFAITGMLIVYCLKDAVVLSWPYALPEIISIAVVVGLFLWRKNSLLAVAVGTVLYMVLRQVVFC